VSFSAVLMHPLLMSCHVCCRQAERNNGRAAMMGITGMMIHNALGVDALFPIVQ